MYKAWISDVKLWPVDAVQRMHHKISYYQHIYCVWPIEYVLQTHMPYPAFEKNAISSTAHNPYIL